MKTKRKHSITKIVVIAVVLVVLFILPWLSMSSYNNIVAIRYLRQLETSPLPEHTQIVGSFWEVGKFAGNGNNTEYFVGIIVSSELDEDDLQQYYEETPFPSARNQQIIQKAHIGIIVDKQLVFEDNYNLHYTPDFVMEQNLMYYCIALYDGGYSPLFEIRSG